MRPPHSDHISFKGVNISDSDIVVKSGQLLKEANSTLCDRLPKSNSESSEFDFSLYQGFSGVVLALHQLSHLFTNQKNFTSILSTIDSQYRLTERRFSESFYCGLPGLLYVKSIVGCADSLGSCLKVSEAAIRDQKLLERNEILFGLPGYLQMLSNLYRHCMEDEIVDLYRRVECLITPQCLKFLDSGEIPVQKFGEKEHCFYGYSHGFLGILSSLAYGLDLGLSALPESRLIEIVLKYLKAFDEKDIPENFFNIPWGKGKRDKYQVQWCHGATGIVLGLRSLYRKSSEIADYLERAGTLICAMGPLAKGSSICHGNSGSGLACMALFEETGDRKYIDYTKRFLTHAMDEPRKDICSLYTGDLGIVYLARSYLSQRLTMPLY